MKKFSIARKDDVLVGLVNETDQKILAVWAVDCALRVLHYFETDYPEDLRPRFALETLQKWLKTGVFHMKEIRGASLGSHAAARDAAENSPAQSAARACGQAVATAHVRRHAYGTAIYAQQAFFREIKSENAENVAIEERDWQYQHLIELREQ